MRAAWQRSGREEEEAQNGNQAVAGRTSRHAAKPTAQEQPQTFRASQQLTPEVQGDCPRGAAKALFSRRRNPRVRR